MTKWDQKVITNHNYISN